MYRLPLGALFVVVALGLAACATPPRPDAVPANGGVPPLSAQTLVYVTNQGAATISVIDGDRQEVVRTIDLQALGFGANAKPHHIAVEPDGSFFYVSLIGEGVVLKFTRNGALAGRTAFEVPGLLALDPDGDLLYVGRSMSAVNPPQRIGAIRRTDMSVEEIDVFFPRPHALVLDAARDVVYTASLSENRLASVTAEGDIEMLSLDGDVHTLVQFALSPDGQTLIGGGQVSGDLLFFDVSDPAAPRLTSTLHLGGAPWHPVFTKDGRFLYVPQKMANTVSVVDVATRKVATVIEDAGLAEPHGATISADGRYVYVSNNNMKGDHMGDHAAATHGPPTHGTVVVIDTATRKVVKVIEVGANATGIGTR